VNAVLWVVIRVSMTLGEALCAVAAEAVDETRIRNRIRVAEAKTIERNFFLLFTYFSFFGFSILFFNVRMFELHFNF
jgi:hypothetical protein